MSYKDFGDMNYGLKTGVVTVQRNKPIMTYPVDLPKPKCVAESTTVKPGVIPGQVKNDGLVAPHYPNIRTDYLHKMFNPEKLHTCVKWAINEMEEWQENNHPFDAIAFRGMSGALLAGPIALGLKKTLVLVRKEDEKRHSCYKVEGDSAARSYIIVDDFVSSGATSRAIVTAVRNFAPQAKFLGLLAVTGTWLTDPCFLTPEQDRRLVE